MMPGMVLKEQKRSLKSIDAKDPTMKRMSSLKYVRGRGDEAALLQLYSYRMYCHYAESKGWVTSIIDSNPTEIGGFKEIVLKLRVKVRTAALNMKAVHWFSGYRRPNPAAEYIHLQQR